MIINGKIKGTIPAPELTEEEKAMSIYKYYTRPYHLVPALYSQAMDHGPMNERYAQPTTDLTEHLLPPGEYNPMVLGYCQHPEGGGIIRHYSFYPGAKYNMLQWFFTWLNIPFKNQPEGCGNMKYKIWCPADHYTHAFMNGVDRSGGVMNQESVSLGRYPDAPFSKQVISIRYPFDLCEFGMTKKRMQELVDAGCWLDPAMVRYYDPKDYWEKGVLTEVPGTHIMITITRPAAGGIEKISTEWIGWEIKDGKVVPNDYIPWWRTSLDWMQAGINHATSEGLHLAEMLPELYAEYAHKPMDQE